MMTSSSSSDLTSFGLSFDDLSMDKAAALIKSQLLEINELKNTLAVNNSVMKQNHNRIEEWVESVRAANEKNKIQFEEYKKTNHDLKVELAKARREKAKGYQVSEDDKTETSDNEEATRVLQQENSRHLDEIKSLKNQQDQLLEQLNNTTSQNEILQRENDNLTEENVNSYQKYQSLLVQTKQESRSVDITDISSKLESYETKTSDSYSNLINDNSELNHYTGNGFHESLMKQLDTERSLVNELRLQNTELEKKIKNVQDTMDSKFEQEREKCRISIQTLQKKHNEEIEKLQNISGLNYMKTMAMDHEALKRQVVTLFQEVTESREENTSLRVMVANKTEQYQRLNDMHSLLREEMKKRGDEDTQLINTLRNCNQDVNKKLIAEREHVIIKQEQNKKLREAFQQLLEDYSQMQEERKELQQQIDFLTAKSYATEESYQVQEDRFNKIKKEKEELASENELLKTQSEMYKADFNAERESSEMKRHKLEETVAHLQMANRKLGQENGKLLSQIEQHTSQQLSEMRQRCANTVKMSNWKPNSDFSSTCVMEATQHEYMEQYQCPQCGSTFPDADSLNLHFEEHHK
ncbi:NF-kappa-B essential modulator-like isoform X1 [Argonauta hians]